MTKLTHYHIPEAKAFNLLGSDENSTETKDSIDVTQSSNKGKSNDIIFEFSVSYIEFIIVSTKANLDFSICSIRQTSCSYSI